MEPSLPDTNYPFDEYFRQKLTSVEVDPLLAEAGWQNMLLPEEKSGSPKRATRYWVLCISLLLLFIGSIYFARHNRLSAVAAVSEKEINKVTVPEKKNDEAAFTKQVPEQNSLIPDTATVTGEPLMLSNRKSSSLPGNKPSLKIDTILLGFPVPLQSLPVGGKHEDSGSNPLSPNGKQMITMDSSSVTAHLPVEKKKDSIVKKAPFIIW